FALSLPAVPTLSDPFSVPFPVRISFPMAVVAFCLSAAATLADFPRQPIIGAFGRYFGMPKYAPAGVMS
ncbi:hypothetical protein, partial [Streptomyces sp. NPDC050504]|uniref:hypothetical protein n=1 Tax=Streptomyces sp. NPDC050504 TaxID=3365618 RepID=UPI0037BA8D27